ncbi:hypothetical protein [Arsenicibacter rosenii]|uniref:Uncharacterized protein n=1 Tax=Arsenicibacter rosenii TaxID=1750698 RepID=A0A1S2VK45_9BACT|nr:hypothetical protein [Arsenicibacter rosenii]OIN58595.1 hypothetical protein BLX24_13575 [Arsenicibacter rosenii]
MTTQNRFRLLLSAFFCLTLVSVSIARPARPRIYPASGFWVVETSPANRQSLVRFYNDNLQVVYQETLPRRLNIRREQTQERLNAVLEKVMEQAKAGQFNEPKLVALELKK